MTVLEVHYNREKNFLVFTANETRLYDKSVKFGAPITPPAVNVAGKLFKGWTNRSGNAKYDTVPALMPDEQLNYEAILEDITTSKTYTVVHMKEKLDVSGDEKYIEALTESLAGPTGATKEELLPAAAKSYTGFTRAKTELKDDKLTIYYDRKVSALNIDPGKMINYTVNVEDESSIRYGTIITLSAEWKADKQSGNKWLGWKSSNEGVLASSTNSEYVFSMPDTVITLTALTEPEKNMCTVIFDANGGWIEDDDKRAFEVGTTVSDTIIIPPARYGYTFGGWYTDAACTTAATKITSSCTLYAKWTADDVTYSVYHNCQSINGQDYSTVETEKLTGKTGEMTAAARDYEGFTLTKAVTQKVIEDSWTEVDIYYARKTYSLTFDFGYDGKKVERSACYGENIYKPYIERAGYVLIGWSPVIPNTMPAADTTYTAKWAPQVFEVNYTVVHKLETANGEYEVARIEYKEGIIGAKTVAAADAAYANYTAKTIDQKIIAPDGSTQVVIEYERKSYELKFVFGNGNADSKQQVKFGKAITAPEPTRGGYLFNGWSPAVAEVMPAANAAYTAQWVATTGNIAYTVEHNLRKLDGGWEKITENLAAPAGTVTAKAKTYQGFAYQSGYDSADGKEVKSGALESGKTLELKLYYERGIYEAEFIPDVTGLLSKTVKAYFGDKIAVPEFERPGYRISGWRPIEPDNMPAKDITFTAVWEKTNDVAYTVKHYKANVDGSYPIAATKTDEKTDGTYGERVFAQSDTYEGFTYDASASRAVGVLNEGETLVLELRYRRNSYNLTFDENWEGGTTFSGSTRFGAAISAPAPTREGYDFIGWDGEVPAFMPAKDVTLTAKWKPSSTTTYYIDYYLEDLNGVLPEDPSFTETKTGTTDTRVNIDISQSNSELWNKFEGFYPVAEGSVNNVVIGRYGWSTLSINFRRKACSLSFDTDGNGSPDKTLLVKYGAPINEQLKAMSKAIGQAIDPASQATIQTPIPIKEGDVFNGWEITSGASTSSVATDSGALPIKATGDISCKALWSKENSPQCVLEYYAGGYKGQEIRYFNDGAKTITLALRAFDGFADPTVGPATNVIEAKIENGNLVVTRDNSNKPAVITLNYSAAEFELEVSKEDGIEKIFVNGSLLVDGKVKAKQGENVTVAVVLKTGYEFKGFECVKEAGYSVVAGSIGNYYTYDYTFTMPDGKIKLIAKATPATYGINWMEGSDYNGRKLPRTYTYGQGLKLPEVLNYLGNQMTEGWMIGSATAPIVTELLPDQTGVVELWPAWKDVVNVTFDAGEGKIDGQSSVTYLKAVGVSFAAPKAIREEYTLEGWYCEGDPYGGTIPDKDKTYIAKWKKEVSDGKVKSVSLDRSSADIYLNDSLTLTATIKPSDAVNKKVTWTTSNSGVAAVTATDLTCAVKGISEGTAKITVTTEDGGFTAECAITVKKKGVTSVTLSQSSLSMKVGETATLTATALPTDATDKTITWTTSNSSVATVSSGVVTAVKDGTATITATAPSGVYATCSVSVSKVAVTGVKLSASTLSLGVGSSSTLSATVSPTNASNKSVTWSTSNSAVATVKDGVVTGVKVGTATITVTTVDGSFKDTCAVTVKNVAVTGVKVSPASVNLKVGETSALTATVEPATASNKNVTWTTSDSGVATVSATGVVTAKGFGSATVTATTADGGFKATCAVSVEVTETISVEVPVRAMLKNTTLILPDVKGYKGTWAVKDAKIAAISNNSLVTALATGTTKLTFTVTEVSDKDAKFNGKALSKGTAYELIELRVREGKKVLVTKVTAPKKLTLDMLNKKTAVVNAKIKPANVSDKELFFVSSDPKVASVDAKGVVTAHKPGKATITVYSTTMKTAKVKVTVKGLVTKLSITNLNGKKISKAEVVATATLQLYTKTNANAADKTVTWTSENTAIATVDKNGLVTAVSSGKVKVYATANDGSGKKATITITVM